MTPRFNKRSRPETIPSIAYSATCWPFYERIQQIEDREMVVFVYDGVEIPMIDTGEGGWRSVLNVSPHLYCASWTREPIDYTGIIHAVDVPTLFSEHDWTVPHSMKQEECYCFSTVAFKLPPTLDEYLASLSKGHRYDFNNANRKCERLTAKHGLPPFRTLQALLDVYEEKFVEKFKFTAIEASNLRLGLEALLYYDDTVNALMPITLYDGDEVVAVNIAERIGNRVLDVAASWFPKYDEVGPIGRYLINKNIELAISWNFKTYDLGLIDPADRDCDYSYKMKWVPKGTVLPTLFNIAVIDDATNEYYKQENQVGVYPPYFTLRHDFISSI